MHWVRTKPYTDSVGGLAGPVLTRGACLVEICLYKSNFAIVGFVAWAFRAQELLVSLSKARVLEYDSEKGAAHKPKSAQATNSDFTRSLRGKKFSGRQHIVGQHLV